MFAVLGVLLLVAGGVLVFAVEKSVEGVDLEVIGWILIGGGALSLLIAAIHGAGWMSMNNTKFRTERHMSEDGQHYVEETRSA